MEGGTYGKVYAAKNLKTGKIWELIEHTGGGGVERGTYGKVFAAKNLKTGKLCDLIEHTGCGGS